MTAPAAGPKDSTARLTASRSVDAVDAVGAVDSAGADDRALPPRDDPGLRLTVIGPQLDDRRLAGFIAAAGRPPDAREPARADWAPASLSRQHCAELAEAAGVDAAILPLELSLADFRLAAFDMDSTLITIECVDEIADYVGRKAEVAAITEAAMRGEISDYDESLRRRVALLAGLPETTLQRVWDERVALTPGAERLVAAMKAAGLKILLVSGGFTFFTDRLRQRLGIDFVQSNQLEVDSGKLTGRLVGKIVNAHGKREAFEATCARIGCSPAEGIAVGDGANDLEMMGIAGLSVAFHAKPMVRARTHLAINHGGLDVLLDWVSARSAPQGG